MQRLHEHEVHHTRTKSPSAARSGTAHCGELLVRIPSGLDGGAFDAERRALRDRKNDLAHRRRILTRFDTWEDDSWLDPDRSGPPNSNLNQLYDDTDLVDDAEERLMAARAEHAEMGDNALDGSQLSEMLAGQGGPPTIAAY